MSRSRRDMHPVRSASRCDRSASRGYRSTSRRAFTLVEVLIAVTISATLLLATAAALKASVDSFSANQASADTLQRARITITRLAAQLRAGSDHLPITASKQASFIAGATVTDSGITFTDDLGQSLDYIYDADARTLRVVVDGGTPRILASHVTSFSVRMTPTRSTSSIKTGGVYDELERVTLTISLNPVVEGSEITGQPLTLSESVTPRARLWN